MKRLAFIFVVVTVSVSAFGQSIDDLIKQNVGKVAGDIVSAGQARRERDQLGKAEAAYNATQEPIRLKGLPIVNRAVDHGYLPSEIKNDLNNVLTGLGIPSARDVEDIRRESDDRRYLRGEDEVDQSTVPAKGTLDAGGRGYYGELSLVEVEKSSYFQTFFGTRFGAGLNFGISRTSAYCALTYALRDRQTGLVVRTFKVVGVASSADNVGGNVAGSIFGGQFGFDAGDSSGDLQFRAKENALKRLGQVLKAKAL